MGLDGRVLILRLIESQSASSLLSASASASASRVNLRIASSVLEDEEQPDLPRRLALSPDCPGEDKNHTQWCKMIIVDPFHRN